ncbi:hypothetical protein Dda_4971 [Drechslerella dactyloides]|uniref:Cyanovirin-N domain-containing protein n=1 Tax=Drechslerella dactyloides TaxID=74499 RepID=A0AAD6J2C4_DREDA|nr:hypothetical protein Dda_4971 [Drechslerella dactyloides]
MKFSYAAFLGLVPSIFAASIPNDSLTKRGGGAFQSCTGPTFEKQANNEIVIHMKCNDGVGGSNQPMLNLNKCIGNQGGKLVWQRDGNFGRSCWLDNGENTGARYNRYLFLFCGNGKDFDVVASIDLDQRLVNRGGILTCDV